MGKTLCGSAAHKQDCLLSAWGAVVWVGVARGVALGAHLLRGGLELLLQNRHSLQGHA